MAHRRRGPSSFGEWIVGTTIQSALRSLPKEEQPKQRDVFKVEVTTDDETEEDSLKITYPRTGRKRRTRRAQRSEPQPTKTIESVKKVRFEDGTGPIKSALKKTKVTTFETDEDPSDSDASTDSSKSIVDSSANGTTSGAESSDEASKSVGCKKRQARSAGTGTDSDCEADPHPTCKCKRCFRGRENIGREYLNLQRMLNNLSGTDTDAETSDSSAKAPHKPKNQQSNKSKKRQDNTTTDTEASESEAEAPAKSKNQTSNKSKAKRGGKDSETEASESEAEIPPKAQRKKGVKIVIESETDGETSESAKESDAEAVKPQKKKRGDISKAENNKKNSQSNKNKSEGKTQKESKKSKKKAVESSAEEESSEEEEEEVRPPKKGKKGKQKKRKSENEAEAGDANMGDLWKKFNEPEGMPGNHTRRPHFIEPIRAQVVQTERVIESPDDPPPNAYYDTQHNVLRVYHGPVYGNHHGHPLYPDRTMQYHPPPMGMPHPLNNPYWNGNDPQKQQGGFNHPQSQQAGLGNSYNPQQGGFGNFQPQQQPGFGNAQQQNANTDRPHPSGAYDYVMPGYSSMPVTQGIPPSGIPAQTAWNTSGFQVPPWAQGQYPVASAGFQPPNPWGQAGKDGKEVVNPAVNGPPSSKDRNKDGENNVVPEALKVSEDTKGILDLL